MNDRGENFLRSEINSDSDSSDESLLNDKFMQLHHVQQLQNSILRHNMHNAMSPLNAISGYLELIDLSISSNSDISQIQYYRKKIETGVKEVNDILEQLQEVYKEQEEFADEAEEIVVDINWLVREVCREMKIKKQQCSLRLFVKPIHISADLYSIKLIIFKLINYALKCSLTKNRVKVLVQEESNNAKVIIRFNASDSKKGEINQVMQSNEHLNSQEILNQNFLNEGLSVSLQLIKYMKGAILFKDGDNQTGSFYLTLPKA